MELTESITSINNQLREQFGIDSDTARPIFRVVWSEDQFEKRLMDYTDEGFQLLTPEMRLVPKYRQWIHERYVLERLVVVPVININELATKLSYEPLWVFETQAGNYLPPKFEVAKIVIDSVYAAMGRKSMRKYVDPEAAEPIEMRKARIDNIVKELFGNETNTTDALAYKHGVVVPGPNQIN